MPNCQYDLRKSKMNPRIDNLQFFSAPVRDIDPDPPSREVGSEVAREAILCDTWPVSPCLVSLTTS